MSAAARQGHSFIGGDVYDDESHLARARLIEIRGSARDDDTRREAARLMEEAAWTDPLARLWAAWRMAILVHGDGSPIAELARVAWRRLYNETHHDERGE